MPTIVSFPPENQFSLIIQKIKRIRQRHIVHEDRRKLADKRAPKTHTAKSQTSKTRIIQHNTYKLQQCPCAERGRAEESTAREAGARRRGLGTQAPPPAATIIPYHDCLQRLQWGERKTEGPGCEEWTQEKVQCAC